MNLEACDLAVRGAGSCAAARHLEGRASRSRRGVTSEVRVEPGERSDPTGPRRRAAYATVPPGPFRTFSRERVADRRVALARRLLQPGPVADRHLPVPGRR